MMNGQENITLYLFIFFCYVPEENLLQFFRGFIPFYHKTHFYVKLKFYVWLFFFFQYDYITL